SAPQFHGYFYRGRTQSGAVVRVATNNNDGHMNQWVNQLKERRGFNKTTVAVANKNARIIWSMLRNDTGYQVV
ncbi:hypothetical protein ACLD37_18560, partial [Salmonella sp. 741265059_PSA]